jgi:hypothetical protein
MSQSTDRTDELERRLLVLLDLDVNAMESGWMPILREAARIGAELAYEDAAGMADALADTFHENVLGALVDNLADAIRARVKAVQR